MPDISVIIPTYNEERNIAQTIEQTRQADECEIVVVDGGSTDNTVAEAQAADHVLTASPGRASQQNTGAGIASGEYLVFLHADCRLPNQFANTVRNILSDSQVAGGCFQQTIDNSARKYRLIENGNAWRVRTLGWIYGDQGLFVSKELFLQLDGFPEMPLMEDLYFSKKLKRAGPLRIAEERIVVSARRWEQRGAIRQTLRNWGFVVMSHVGVSPKTLASWYGNVREIKTGNED